MTKQAKEYKVVGEGKVHVLSANSKGVEQGISVALTLGEGVNKLKFAPRYKTETGEWGFGWGQANIEFKEDVILALIKDLQALIELNKKNPPSKKVSAVKVTEMSTEELIAELKARQAKEQAHKDMKAKSGNGVKVPSKKLEELVPVDSDEDELVFLSKAMELFKNSKKR